MVGTGFVVQDAVAAQNDRIAETRALADAANRDIQQLDAHGGILEARAVKQAEDTLAGAGDTIAAAQGKTDATALAASVAALDHYRLLAPERVFALVDSTKVHADTVRGAVAEADRIAAEQAAAAAAAAAAAQAAAEAAAAAAEAEPSSPSTSSRPGAPANPSAAQAIARDMLLARGWGDDQFGCLVELWNHESGWNVYASNPSGAYGIPQALPGSKMATAGDDWETNPATQISWGLGYITGRYGTPCGAWDAFNSQGWY
jgi:chemotaxis protein histidine kinase CheA